MLPKAINITTIIGKTIVSLTTNWQTQNGPFNVEYVAADIDLLG